MVAFFECALALFSVRSQARASIRLHSTTVSASGVPAMDVTIVEKLKYDDLLQWMRKQGSTVNDKIYIDDSERGGGYGAFVDEAIAEGEILFEVPRTVCVTLDNVKKDTDCGRAFEEVMEKAGPGGNTVVMAGYLAKEYLKYLAGDESGLFGPYLDTLPWERGVNAQEHVLFWSNRDVEENLKGSFCYPESMGLRSEVKLATKVLDNIVGPSIREARGEAKSGFQLPWEKNEQNGPVEGLSGAVTGAFVSILTRGFEDGVDGAEKLVPLLDMLQHADEPNVSHNMRKADGVVEVKARRDIAVGEELLNQYRAENDDAMPYHRFFSRFGFVPDIMEPVGHLLADESSIFYPKAEEV
uniref:SET domain-containing protein n=1 Tax=Grammatophora oceanica TaxID=210454 RepID=A0A7S1Y3W3_9STRA|mmetsp:Transcript_17544/g.25997  ORF Transcript_17544/g.25997 Transcript_17544/m.25997 type:complete len:355 (+) Transcript_17544:107-1171(+)